MKKYKKVLCIGDSLTEGDYGVKGKFGVSDIRKENYPFFLSELMGCEVINKGRCGSTATLYLEYYKQANLGSPDIDLVLVMLGTNGGLDVEQGEGNEDYDELIKLIQKDFINARLILITPPHATDKVEYTQHSCKERVFKARRFIKEYAKKNNIELIDTAKFSEFNDDNLDLYQANDGTHYVLEGYKQLAKRIYEQIKSDKN